METKLASGERLAVLVDDAALAPEDPTSESVGVLSAVHQALRTPDQHLQILIRPPQRVRVEDLVRTEPHVVVRIEAMSDDDDLTEETHAVGRTLAQQFDRWSDLQPQIPGESRVHAQQLARRPGPLSDFVTASLDLDDSQRQSLLSQRAVRLWLDLLLPILEHELQMLEMGEKIQQQVRRELGQGQREHFLREQMKAIQKELTGAEDTDVDSLHERVARARLSDEARSEAERELARLDQMQAGSAEASVVRSYVETLVELPWQRRARERLDVQRTRNVLDRDHEGTRARQRTYSGTRGGPKTGWRSGSCTGFVLRGASGRGQDFTGPEYCPFSGSKGPASVPWWCA